MEHVVNAGPLVKYGGKAGIITTVLFLVVNLVSGQSTDHWESMTYEGMEVTYLVPQSELPSNWNEPSFNDGSWDTGITGIGYGDGDDQTTVDPCISVYLRYPISIQDTAKITSLLLDMDFDDAFAAYLNGIEIARYNLGEPGSATTWDQQSDGYHEALLYQGQLPMRFNLHDSLADALRPGNNILAVEVHNHSVSSSDLTANAWLQAGIEDATRIFSQVPGWFVPPVSQASNLPVIAINTNGQTIPDEPRITAHMGIIDNGQGNLNHPSDIPTVYDGRISIELRGESTLMFPKKSYRIETQLPDGSNFNLPLLGFPEENDWILYAPYSDKSMLRNVITYTLYEQMGNYAPRTRYVEVYLNDQYQGVYVFMEKIKQDDDRVNIAKITPSDTSPSDISGGYIFRIDKTTNMDPSEYWTSMVDAPHGNHERITFQYYDPGREELLPEQATYLRTWIGEVEEVLASSYFKDPQAGYRQYLEVPSFIDHMILNELSKDVDAYRLSSYFYKHKDIHGNKIVAGPPWDYNLTYGNMDYGDDIRETYNWLYDKWLSPWWWERLMEDPWYRNQLYCRWDTLHAELINQEAIFQMIDSSISELGDAVTRNYQRWPVLGTYVWPNHFIGQTYEEEVEFLKSWIADRIGWLNTRWGGYCEPSQVSAITRQDNRIRVYPNPSDLTRLHLVLPEQVSTPLRVTLTDMQGKIAWQGTVVSQDTGNRVTLPGLEQLPAGVYFLKAETGEQRWYTRVISD